MRIVTGLLFLGVVFSAPGCTGESPPPPSQDPPPSPTAPTTEAEALLEACTLDRSLDLFATLGGLPDLLLAAQDAAAAAGVVVVPSADPADPPFAFTYHVPIDLDRDGQGDDAIDGRVTFSKDPLLGFVPGDAAALSWTLLGYDAQGSGTLDLRFTSAGTVQITGGGAITTGGCTMDFDIDEAHPVAMSLPAEPAAAAPQGPARRVPMTRALPAAGRIRFLLALGADTLGGTLAMGALGVDVRDIDVNGAWAPDFALNLG